MSLTGINFNTRSVIGATDLSILPLKDNLKHIRLNAKQGSVRQCNSIGDPLRENNSREFAKLNVRK